MTIPQTHWSLIRRAGSADSTAGRQALSQVLAAYAPVLRRHLIVHKRVQPSMADDVLQDFVVNRILEGALLAQADPQRGRFRSLLLTALDNYLVTRIRADHAQRRHLPDNARAELDEASEVASDDDPSRAFDLAWAQRVIEQAQAGMRRECDEGHRHDLWAVFEARLLRPETVGGELVTHTELASRLNLSSAAQAANLLITAKRMLQRHVRRIIAEYAASEAEIEAEIRDLLLIAGYRNDYTVSTIPPPQ